MTIRTAIANGSARLRRQAIASARLDTLILLEKVTLKDRAWLLAHPEADLPAQEASRFTALIKRRAAREPLAYLTNRAAFYGLDLFVDNRTLIPRPETELLVEAALAAVPAKATVLDMGTGSGAIAIALASERPDLTVTAADISARALRVARKNARSHALPITFVKSDLFSNLHGRFDCILANLPYLSGAEITQPELSYEPQLALLGGGTSGCGLYQSFLGQAPAHLNRRGLIFLEAQPDDHQLLITAAREHGFEVSFQKDLVVGLKLEGHQALA